MFFNGLLKTGVFFYIILGFEYAFSVFFPCDFSVVSDDIWHCSVLFIAAVCVSKR